MQGERRQLTVLFCDLVGSTELSHRLDPEDLREVVRAYQEAAAAVVGRHEGHIAQYLGDGVLVYFGHPRPHEDDPARAVRAGLEIVGAVRALTHPRARLPEPLQVRVGIHTGLVVVGEVGGGDRHEQLALGETPNVAARLQAIAAPNTVAISDATQRLVAGLFESEPLGPHPVKGVAEPLLVHRVRAASGGTDRFAVSLRRGLTPLVGRRRELETLAGAWQAARTGVRVVNVVAEAGIGKSRLVYEFSASLVEAAFFLSGHCTAEGRSAPFLPFIEVTRTVFQLRDGDPKIEEKIRRRLEVLGLAAGEIQPYLLHLLGQPPELVRALDAEIVGRRTRRALQTLLEARCRLSPTVLVIEDLHWIDTASEEYLAWAAGIEQAWPLLVVCTHRPDYRPPWAGRANSTELRLGPLSRSSTIELVTSRLGAGALPARLGELVAEKAEGNPLFAEELALYLQEPGAGGADSPGRRDVSLPVTLENLLMDRIGRLAEGPRAVLQAASVIGRRFSPDLIAHVCQLDGALPDWLRELERQDLVYREAERDEFAFKHALVRDAVYQNLLRARREELHGGVARTLEEAYGGRLEEIADALADHYSQTRHADKAVRYLALAGARSLALYSLDEAEARFRQALDLIRTAPGCADDAFLADVLLKLARVHYFRCDFKSLMAMVGEYLPRVEALGDKRRLSRFLFETGYAHVFAARQDVGGPLLERALALAEEIGDEESIGYACMGLIWEHVYWGTPSADRRAKVERFGTRALEIGKRVGDVWLTSKALIGLASDAGHWGRVAESLELRRRLLRLSDETGDPRPRGMGLWALSFHAAYVGELDAALEYAEAAVRTCVSPLDRVFSHLARAMALTLLGRTEQSLSRYEEIRRQTAAGEMRISGLLAEDLPYGLALALSGEMARGVRWIEAAVERYVAWGQPFARAYGDWNLGQIYLQMVQGGARPSPAVMWRNLGFLLRTAPFAARLARRHLEAALAEFRRLEIPYAVADSLFQLGLLHQAKRRTAEARARFEEARPVAASVGGTHLCERIDAALASLAP